MAVTARKQEGTKHKKRGTGRDGNSESTKDVEHKRTTRDEEICGRGAEIEART